MFGDHWFTIAVAAIAGGALMFRREHADMTMMRIGSPTDP
jgi:hypothetical protein